MHNILIVGAGKIGSLVACLLIESGDYHVYLADKNPNGADILRLQTRFPQLKTLTIDIQNQADLEQLVKQNSIQAVISSLPYYCNSAIAHLAQKCNLHYFDLTEDVATTATIEKLAAGANNAFVPQCGLAPGFINIAAHTLMQEFDSLDTAKLRVGALPQHTSNALKYALTWSTDGLINEYGNLSYAIENNEAIRVPALSGLETLILDGRHYETFHTSGGIASLTKTYAGKIKNLNYKTIRYPGHCEKMRFLLQDLNLNADRDTLKKVLEHSLPRTQQDIVLIYISVLGTKNGQLLEKSYTKEIYPQEISGLLWSAIQITTASSVAAVIDIVLNHADHYHGLVLQEQFTLATILNNRFGRYYQ